MKLFRDLPRNDTGVALTIGNFDGVHLGHKALLRRTLEAARERELVPAVMTFEPHPREFFDRKTAPGRLSSVREKIVAIRRAGMDQLYLPRFNAGFAAQDPLAFIDLLQRHLQVKWLLVGQDFRFGARRAGDLALLQAQANIRHTTVETLPDVTVDGTRVSSTAIRSALSAGDLDVARALLGHPYVISGHVIHGRKLGRTLGFPTANISMSRRKPALSGVFAVRCRGSKARGLEGVATGVASLGTNPAVQVNGRPTLEVFLFDFSADLYGQRIEVEFVAKLRDEAHYASLDELTAQIRRDADHAREILGQR